MTLPQIQGMYNGDRSKKRLWLSMVLDCSALDNRPSKIEEFHQLSNQVIFTSATPSEENWNFVVERLLSKLLGQRVFRSNRFNRKTNGQIEHLISEIREIAKKIKRVLNYNFDKKMSEDLTDYVKRVLELELGIYILKLSHWKEYRL